MSSTRTARSDRSPHFDDEIVSVTAGPDHALYLISHKDAPRGKLLKLEPGVSDLADATLLVAQSDAVMQGGGEFGGEPVIITPGALYLRELIGGPSRVAMFDHAGKAEGSAAAARLSHPSPRSNL